MRNPKSDGRKTPTSLLRGSNDALGVLALTSAYVIAHPSAVLVLGVVIAGTLTWSLTRALLAAALRRGFDGHPGVLRAERFGVVQHVLIAGSGTAAVAVLLHLGIWAPLALVTLGVFNKSVTGNWHFALTRRPVPGAARALFLCALAVGSGLLLPYAVLKAAEMLLAVTLDLNPVGVRVGERRNAAVGTRP